MQFRVARAFAYTVGALLGALVTFALVQYALEPLRSRVAVGTTFVAGAVLAALWARRSAQLRLSIRNRQIDRQTARGAFRGPLSFGFLVGLGWWTIIMSPYFWPGLLACAFTGKAIVGAAVYAGGRSLTAWYGALLPRKTRDATQTVWMFVYRLHPFLIRVSQKIAIPIFLAGVILASTHLR